MRDIIKRAEALMRRGEPLSLGDAAHQLYPYLSEVGTLSASQVSAIDIYIIGQCHDARLTTAAAHCWHGPHVHVVHRPNTTQYSVLKTCNITTSRTCLSIICEASM